MIQCQICQVSNEDAAQFCRECGGRLNPGQPLAAPSPAAGQNPNSSAPSPISEQAPPKPRPKLHSPILGSSGPEPSDYDEEPVTRKGRGQSQSQSLSTSRKGLRSPLLGGSEADDDYMDADEDEPTRGKGGLRSPMLGGGGGGGAKSKTAFPHRGDFEPEDSRPADRLDQGKPHGKGLRSPLLGGSDFDPEESFDDPGINSKASGQVKAHHRLRSPILGGGESEYYDDEVFDEEVEEVEDPTALRSPLLAVRSPRSQSQSQVQMQSQAKAELNQAQAPAPLQAPAPAPAPAPPTGPAPGQSMLSPQQQLPPLPYQTGPSAAPNLGPTPSQGQGNQPSFTPQPAPLPSNSQYNLAAQKYEYGIEQQPTSAPTSRPTQEPISASSLSSPPKRPLSQEPAAQNQPRPEVQNQALSSSDSSNSTDETTGPKERRSRERRQSRLIGTGNSPALDDDELGYSRSNDLSGRSQGSSSPNPMAPLLMAASVMALIAKGYSFSLQLAYPDFIAKNMPFVIDQLATAAVFLCLILFAMKASQRH